MRSPRAKTDALTPWLVSHGQEHIALGGPTTRLLQIKHGIESIGREVVSTNRITDALNANASVGLTHIFNSWALQSALNSLCFARRVGKPVVFSPIMLNLANRPFYDSGVKTLMQRATSDSQIEDGAALIREMTPDWHLQSGVAPRQGEKGHFDMIRRQTALADRIICLSTYEKALLTSIGVDSDRMTIVENGVDTGIMADADETQFAEKFGLKDFVLMVGRIESRKNQALAAFALRELDVPLVCIGHVGDPDYFKALKRWAGPSFVHIDRITDRAMLASAYKAAKLLLLPSWSEGAPLVALEAAAAGTPLVLSCMSSEPDYFGDWATYVHPADTAGLKSAVAAQMANPDTADRRQARSDMACKRFSIARHVDKTLAVYDSVLRESESDSALAEHTKVQLDATHLAHQIHNRKPLTGVPVVEKELGRAILSTHDSVTVLAWSSRSRQHESVANSAFATAAMGAVADRPPTAAKTYDLLCEPAELSISPTSSQKLSIVPKRGPGFARRGLTLFKHGINTLPGALRRPVIALCQRARPGFSAIVLPEHHLLERARNGPSRASTTDASQGQVRLQVHMRPEPQRNMLKCTQGGRLIVLGQAWISNDRYLDDVIELVARNDLRLWVHVPDILYATRPGTFEAELSATFTRRLTRILAIADTVVTISSQSAAEIKAFLASRGLERAVRQIYLGVTKIETPDPQVALPRNLASPYILYVASMSARKRHDFLIEAWRRARASSANARATKLVLVGQPLPGFERFSDPAYQANLSEDGVQVINECDATKLARLYSRAEFTVYPSEAEGWGLPPIESLIMGKPCLISDGLPVALETQSGGLKPISAQSVEAWDQAIRYWLDDPAALQKAASDAAAFVPPKWDTAASIILGK